MHFIAKQRNIVCVVNISCVPVLNHLLYGIKLCFCFQLFRCYSFAAQIGFDVSGTNNKKTQSKTSNRFRLAKVDRRSEQNNCPTWIGWCVCVLLLVAGVQVHVARYDFIWIRQMEFVFMNRSANGDSGLSTSIVSYVKSHKSNQGIVLLPPHTELYLFCIIRE